MRTVESREETPWTRVQLVGRSGKATRGEEGKEERRSRASPRAESRELESNPCPNFDFRYDVPLLRVDVLILHLCSTFAMRL